MAEAVHDGWGDDGDVDVGGGGGADELVGQLVGTRQGWCQRRRCRRCRRRRRGSGEVLDVGEVAPDLLGGAGAAHGVFFANEEGPGGVDVEAPLAAGGEPAKSCLDCGLALG